VERRSRGRRFRAEACCVPADAVALTCWRPWVAQLVYALTALMGLVPNRRIEKVIAG